MNKMTPAELRMAKALVDLLCDEMEREAPLHNVQVYLHVALADARGETLEVKEIQEAVGLTSSATSRALGAIGEWSYKNRPGLGLVRSIPDYTDRRRKPMALTDSGRKLMSLVIKKMKKES